MQRMDDKVERISNEVNNIRTNTIRSEQTDTINNLKREIDELKNENLELRQRNATITYVMADLQTKVKDIENEKNSLITAIKLIQLDQSNSNGSQNQVNGSWQSVRNKKTNISQTSKDKDVRKTAAGVANESRYEVLSDLDVEDDEITQISVDVVAEGVLENEQSTSKNINLTQSTSHRKKGRTKTNTVIVGDSILDDNEIQDVTNVGEKHTSKAVQVERMEQSYAAEASEASNDPKKRNLDGSEQSSKAGRKEQSYRQSRNVRQTKDNQGRSQDRNSPNDAPILLILDSIIKNIDPRKMSRRRTVRICLPGKRAEQITAEVKSIPVINPSHVIIHAGTNNLPTDSEHECVKHVEDLAKCTKARFPDAKVALSAITPRRDIDPSAKVFEVNNMIQEL